MEKKKNELMIVQKKGIFGKLANFFRTLFLKNNDSQMNTPDEIPETREKNTIEKNTIRTELKIESNKAAEDKKNDKFYKLNEYLSKGLVKSSDLTQAQRNKLAKWYIDEINNLKNSLKESEKEYKRLKLN